MASLVAFDEGRPRDMDDWEEVKSLGSGSFGIVKLWRNRLDGDLVAVKVCRHLTPKDQERWDDEVGLPICSCSQASPR